MLRSAALPALTGSTSSCRLPQGSLCGLSVFREIPASVDQGWSAFVLRMHTSVVLHMEIWKNEVIHRGRATC